MPSNSANTASGTDIGSGSYTWTESAMGSGSEMKMAFAVSSLWRALSLRWALADGLWWVWLKAGWALGPM